MDKLKLCESEYRFMAIVWDNEPLKSSKLVTICEEKLNWKKSTTYTTLKKLCLRGIASNENTIVKSLVPKDKVQNFECNRFMERVFYGSIPELIKAYYATNELSEEDAQEIKNTVDSLLK